MSFTPSDLHEGILEIFAEAQTLGSRLARADAHAFAHHVEQDGTIKNARSRARRAAARGTPVCACGCNRIVVGATSKRRYFNALCKKRAYERRTPELAARRREQHRASDARHKAKKRAMREMKEAA